MMMFGVNSYIGLKSGKMDILEIFENLGLGFGIIILLIIIFIIFAVIMYIGPIMLHFLGGIIRIVVILAIILIVVYFIGKFAKGFLK